MRIITLIIVVVLVAPGFVLAVDPAGQTDPQTMSEFQEVRSYTGIIKNRTRYEVSIPSENSDATVLIPPNGWIEYTIWNQRSNVTAYHDGQPFYCLNLFAHPLEYSFMCKKYDFIAEIIPPDPVRKFKPIRKKQPPKQKPCVEGVEAFG